MIKKFFITLVLSFFVAFLTTCILSPRIWYENISSIFLEIFQKQDWYSTENSPRFSYNKAISEAKKGNFDSAENLLKNINTLEKGNFSRNILELQGDIAYAKKTSTGQIIALYDRSLEIEKNPRVLYKKSLILDAKSNKKSDESVDEENQEEIKKSLDEIQKTQENRSQYLDAADTSYKKEELDRIKRALGEENYTPIKDW